MLLFAVISCRNNDDTSDIKGDAAEESLPYIGNHDDVIKEVDGRKVTVKEYEQLPHLRLTDQNGIEFSTEQIEGKAYVVYFFFTSCPGICPAMTNQMKRAHEALKQYDDFYYLAVTIDPERDSAAVLKEYVRTMGVDDKNWFFLTGNEQYIHQMGFAYKANVMESDDPESGGFLHSEHFLLVDGERHLRGIYTGTDTGEVDRFIDEVAVLMKEKDQWKTTE
jgi:protein SCO1/2